MPVPTATTAPAITTRSDATGCATPASDSTSVHSAPMKPSSHPPTRYCSPKNLNFEKKFCKNFLGIAEEGIKFLQDEKDGPRILISLSILALMSGQRKTAFN